MAVKADSTVVSQLEELCSSKLTWEIRSAEFLREAAKSSSVYDRNYELQSPTFYSPNYGAIRWKLNYIYGHSQIPEISLSLVSFDRRILHCTVNWSFLNEEHKVVRQMKPLKYTFSKLKEEVYFPSINKPCYGAAGNQPPVPEEYNLDKYVVNDKLIIHVEVKACVCVHSIRGRIITNNNLLHSVSLLEDLHSLLVKEENKDLTLIVGGNKLKVHKTIVSARSPVLAAMLDEDKDCDELHIPDVHLDTMERVVQYMYTDQVDDIEEMGDQLYAVACKYKLLGLQKMYEDHKMKSLTVENVVQNFVIAAGFSGGFKTLVLDFMKSHGVDVTATSVPGSVLRHPG